MKKTRKSSDNDLLLPIGMQEDFLSGQNMPSVRQENVPMPSGGGMSAGILDPNSVALLRLFAYFAYHDKLLTEKELEMRNFEHQERLIAMKYGSQEKYLNSLSRMLDKMVDTLDHLEIKNEREEAIYERQIDRIFKLQNKIDEKYENLFG